MSGHGTHAAPALGAPALSTRESDPWIVGTFLDAYIEAALFSETGPDDEPLDGAYWPGDLAPETRERMRRDCEWFIGYARDTITLVEVARQDSSVWRQAAIDFWLTRNGHGAGFWDGDWPEDAEIHLMRVAQGFGECYLSVGDDGRICAQ